jgi:hypothetical protein
MEAVAAIVPENGEQQVIRRRDLIVVVEFYRGLRGDAALDSQVSHEAVGRSRVLTSC